jgi:RNA polymerase sigma-70 factor, ECF subfamily
MLPRGQRIFFDGSSAFFPKVASVGVERLKQGETDRELVEQALGGRVEAFNLLVWRWQRHLYNFLLRLSGDRSRAEEICQEALLRSYVSLKELREKERFASWLFRIAVNLYRSDQRRPSVPTTDALDVPVYQNWVEAHPMPRETQLAIRALITRLRPELREVVLLRFFHGFQFEEMAVLLDCPVSTLKSRLYKAVEELRAGLQSHS